MGEQRVGREIADQAIRFLDSHRLETTPANYAFAYLYLTGTTSAMQKAVDEITDGGFRLSQTEVDDLMKRVAENSDTSNDEADEMKALIRHQLLSVADLRA
jgi:predicted transcriptional regulator